MRQKVGGIATVFTNLEWDVVAQSSAGNLEAGTINFYVSGLNRVGRNLLSEVRTVVIAQGDSLEWTLGSTLVKAGEDLQRVILSAERTGNKADAVQIAEFKYKLDDGVSTSSLPALVTITNPLNLITDIALMSVADFTDLAAIANPISGMLRSVDAEGGQWYRYDQESASWIPHYFTAPYTDIANTKNIGGSDQLISASAPLIIPLPPVDTSGTRTTTIPLRFEIQNGEEGNSGNSFTGEFNLRIAVNGAVTDPNGRFYGVAFNNLFKFVLVGYRRIATRELNTSMFGAGVEQTWDVNYNKLLVPVELLVGRAIVYDVYIDTDTINLNAAGYEEGDVLGISFDTLSKTGVPTDLGALVGDRVVFGEGNKALYVPNKLLDGAVVIGNLFARFPEQSGITGNVVPDSANQAIVINSAPGGTARISGLPVSLLSSEGIRCIFGTDPGFSEASEVSDPYQLNAPAALVITMNNPVSTGNLASIRADYPDPQIAGRNDATWDAPSIRIFLVGTSKTYQKNTLIPADSAPSQSFTILNLDDFTEISGGIPSGNLIYGTNFSLFHPLKAEIGETTGGAVPADTYTVRVVYVYTANNTKITRINHVLTLSGALSLIPQTIGEIASQINLWRDTHFTTASARLTSTSDLVDGAAYLFADKGYATYIYRADVFLPDDGVNAISPLGLGTFVPQPTKGLRVGTTSELFDAASNLIFTSGFTLQQSLLNDAVNISVDTSLFVPQSSRQNVLSPSGAFLKAPNGKFIFAP